MFENVDDNKLSCLKISKKKVDLCFGAVHKLKLKSVTEGGGLTKVLCNTKVYIFLYMSLVSPVFYFVESVRLPFNLKAY